MAQRCRCGRSDSRSTECVAREEAGTVVRAAEDVPMCRHVNSAGRGHGYSDVEWQLCRIACLLEEQNRMMAQLLQRVREQG